ncbi:MAG: nucleotidyltransferase domain-containing protein [bacterium]|nr:nucleotidyltransferase domain-containing protein [bacterium]
MMLKARLMRRFAGQIHKVILFGSRARDNAADYSDYDFLIILEKNVHWKLEDEILARL